jgi:poly-gamma-glutamate capsule biosynthesis protein CapA/YwtB (metallophosphatase superfamily)
MLIRILFLLSTTLFLSGGVVDKSKKSSQNIKANITELPLEKKVEKPVSQSLKLLFAGDIMSQLPQIVSTNMGNGRYDYTPCFQYIRPILESADLAIGNLECTLAEKPPYSGFPHFISPNQLAKALKINGFDVLVTSNNHALDNAQYGLENTIDAVREAGLMQTGTFKNANHRTLLYPLIVYKKGFKIALLNYTHHTNGFKVTPPNIVNRLEMKAIKNDLAEAKKLNPDFIITFLHWGEEHHLVEDDNQREVAKLLHLWGADLIVGSHPHVVQPIKMESVKKKDGFLVAYSLGNFISAQPFINTEGGILFEVDIEKTDLKTTVSDYHYIPVLRYTPVEKGSTKFYALPVSPYEGHEEVLKMPWHEKVKMDAFAKRVRVQLDAYGAKEHKFDLKDIQPFN